MRIINTSYEVLSDPALRRQHDEWIRSVEFAPDVSPQSKGEAPPEPISRPEQTSAPYSDTRTRYGFYWPLLAILPLVGLMAWGIFSGITNLPATAGPAETSSPAMAPPPYVLPSPNPAETASPAAARPHYVRPSFAPNGQPWPLASNYLSGYDPLNTDGLSSVLIDNRRSDSDVFVKLFDRALHREACPPLAQIRQLINGRKACAVRQLLIRAHDEFKLTNIRPGKYDIRYRDLDSGVTSRSEPFGLDEVPETNGRKYTVWTITLYKVLNGNTHFEIIPSDEF
jgi:hypothetical protein